jgi:hypothetical protein
MYPPDPQVPQEVVVVVGVVVVVVGVVVVVVGVVVVVVVVPDPPQLTLFASINDPKPLNVGLEQPSVLKLPSVHDRLNPV